MSKVSVFPVLRSKVQVLHRFSKKLQLLEALHIDTQRRLKKRQADIETHRQADIETHIQTGIETHRQTEIETHRKGDIEPHRQTDIKIH